MLTFMNASDAASPDAKITCIRDLGMWVTIPREHFYFGNSDTNKQPRPVVNMSIRYRGL